MDVAALLASARSWKAGQPADAEAARAAEAAIIKAAREGDSAALAAAIDQGGAQLNLDCTPGFDGNTALHWAVEKGHLECVRMLCARGAKVDSRERWRSWTPLMVAASKDRREEAEALLAHGAAVDARAKGQTAVDLAAGPEMRSLLQPGSQPADERAPRLSRFWKLHADYEALVERATGVLTDEDWLAVAPGCPMSWLTEREDVRTLQWMVAEIRRRVCAKDATFNAHGYNLRRKRERE